MSQQVEYATKEDIKRVEKFLNKINKKMDLILEELEILDTEKIKKLIKKIEKGEERIYKLEEVMKEFSM